jgi:hypothetical protein
VVGLLWGFLRWKPEYLGIVEPFVVLFFLNYLAVTLIPLFHKKIESWSGSGLFRPDKTADSALLVTLPFVFMIFQFGICSNTEYGSAISCLCLAFSYFVYGFSLRKNSYAKLLGYRPTLLLILALSFFNLSIPFFFLKASSTAIWALEGSFLLAYAVSFEKETRLSGYATIGIFLQIAAILLYFISPFINFHSTVLILEPERLLNFRGPISPLAFTGFLFSIASFISVWFLMTMHQIGENFSSLTVWNLVLELPPPKVSAWFFSVYGASWLSLSSWHVGLPLRVNPFYLSAFFFLALGGAIGIALALLTSGRKHGFWPKNEDLEGNPKYPFLVLVFVPLILSSIYTFRIGLSKFCRMC